MSVSLLWRLMLPTVMRLLEYRVFWFFQSLLYVAAPMVSLLVWLAVADQGARLPYDREQFVTYFLLLAVVSLLTTDWEAEWPISTEIRTGRLSPWLLRPVPPVLRYVADNLGLKVVNLLLQLPVIVAVAVIFREDLRPPEDPGSWLLFGASLPLAAAVSFLLAVLIACLAFWIQNIRGVLITKETVAAFLAGQIVPLALFPPPLRELVWVQPFRYALSFPVEVLVGDLSDAELAWGFALQVGWYVILAGCCRLVWRRGLRAYSATGA